MLKYARRHGAASSVLFVLAVLSQAETRAGQLIEQPTREHPMIGVLAWPAIFGGNDEFHFGEDGRDPSAAFPLFAEPSPASAMVFSVSRADDVESIEAGYETLGAPVYGRRDGWLLLATRDGRHAWLPPGHGGRFHALEDILLNGLTFFNHWDGRLFDRPDGRVIAVPPDERVLAGVLDLATPEIARPWNERDAGTLPCRGEGTFPDGRRVLYCKSGVDLPVRREPHVNADVLATMYTGVPGFAIKVTDTGSDRHRIPVLASRQGWYQVALREPGDPLQRGWIQDIPAVGVFRAIATADEMTELRILVWGNDDRNIRVIGARTERGRLWLHVQLMSGAPCSVKDEEPVPVLTAWVPAHTATNKLVVWHYTRGC